MPKICPVQHYSYDECRLQIFIRKTGVSTRKNFLFEYRMLNVKFKFHVSVIDLYRNSFTYSQVTYITTSYVCCHNILFAVGIIISNIFPRDSGRKLPTRVFYVLVVVRGIFYRAKFLLSSLLLANKKKKKTSLRDGPGAHCTGHGAVIPDIFDRQNPPVDRERFPRGTLSDQC